VAKSEDIKDLDAYLMGEWLLMAVKIYSKS